MKQNALFNINRIVANAGSASKPPVESEFLCDLDYTLRRLNSSEPHYYFKKITQETNPEYFDASNKMVNYVCVRELPEPSADNAYDTIKAMYLTDSGEHFVCLYSDGKPSRRYKPSSMKCIRNMFYQLTGADLDAQLQKSGDFYGICESGEDRHKRIQSAVSKMSEFCIDAEFVDVEDYVKQHNLPLIVESKKEFETKLYDPDTNTIFLCDGIIKYHGEYYILEIKTESSFKWNKRYDIEPEHKTQAITYSIELGIPSIIFIYENRDICTKKSYLYTPTEADKNAVAARIKQCDEYVANGIVPPKPDLDEHICQYCDYKTVCKKDTERTENEESKQG